MAEDLMDDYCCSLRKACHVVMLSTSQYYYRSGRKDERVLRLRMRQIAATRVRYGFWRIFILLRREGFTDNHKRVYRLYKDEKLNLRSKRPRRSRSAEHRLARIQTQTMNQVWSMDFASDALFDGRRFRILAVVDNYSKKCLCLNVGQSLKGNDVKESLQRIFLAEGALPARMQSDNGSEFISKEVDRWAFENKVTMDFSRPGKPTDNPYVESFIGKFRDECLSVNWFLSLDHAQQIIEEWRQDYNRYRPHCSLGDLTPEEFIQTQTPNPENSTFGCL
jgi:putative transposase